MPRSPVFSPDVLRAAAPLVLGAGVVVGVLAEWVAFNWDEPRRWLPDLVVGLVFVGAGALVLPRRAGTGWLLTATGFAWFAGTFAAELSYLHRGPLAHAILAYVGWRARGRVELLAIAVGYLAAFVNPLWNNDIAAIALLATLVAVVWFAPGHRRSERRPARQAVALLALAVVVFIVINRAVSSVAALEWTLVMYDAALCGVAILLAARLVPTSAAAVTDLVVELGDSSPDTMRAALAEALGDPGLQIGYLATDGRYLAPDLNVIDLPAPGQDRVARYLERDGHPFAVLVHDATVRGETGVAEAVSTATRLSAANAALTGQLRDQLDALDASRRRLLLTADEQRRRLEARLRNGGEKRISALAASLDALPPGTAAGHVDLARAHLERAVDELRAIGRGLHPRDLDAGLRPAVLTLAARCRVPVTVAVDSDAVIPDEIAVAAYYVCAEALANISKHAAATAATISVSCAGGRLTVTVVDDGAGGADPAHGAGLRGLTDRVEAIGGTLDVTSPAGGPTRLVAELPLDDQPR